MGIITVFRRFWLASLSAFTALAVASCGGTPCLSQGDVTRLVDEGRGLEQAGRPPQEAYSRYKIAEGRACSNTPARAEAFENAHRLQIQIEAAYYDAVDALRRHREMYGRYPDTLAAIESDVPTDSQAALAGFFYVRHDDDDADIDMGMVTHSFDLR